MNPWKPEPIETLRGRFNAAIATAFTFEDVAHRLSHCIELPTLHYFDSEDGIRLIVTKETDEGRDFIHFSASMAPESPTSKRYDRRQKRDGHAQAKRDFCADAVQRFHEISGLHWPVEFDHFTAQKGVPNWVMSLPEAGHEGD